MAMEKNNKSRHETYSITVCKNGPYLVSGGVPLLEKIIKYDAKRDTCQWEDGRTFPVQNTYALCRCGQSHKKPFCDGTHLKVNFDGTEAPPGEPCLKNTVEIVGPGLRLTDAKDLCASARFCHRGGGIWALIPTSDNPADKKIAIEITADCPSGRLVVSDVTTGKPIEPTFEPSIVLIEDPYMNVSGPLWVRGGIPITSSDGTLYVIRNRVTLCRCGKSCNKPFCDSSHWPE